MNTIKQIINKIKNKDEKTKNLLNNISISFVLKGLSMIFNLLLIPLYISFFSDEIVLGVWLTIISLLNYICQFDVGIGNGIRNFLVKPLETKNYEEIKKIVSTGYISIFCLSVLIIIIFLCLFDVLPWFNIFNVTSSSINYTDLKFMIVFIFIGAMIHFILNLINSISYAMQKSFVPSLILNITNLIVIIGLFIYNYLNIQNKILYVCILNVLSIFIPYVIFTIIIFNTKLKNCFVAFKYFDFVYLKQIISLGLKFLYAQIISLVFFNLNEYLISVFTSPDNVVAFQVYNKIFYSISAVFGMMLVPLWSAVKEAIVQKDYNWINSMFNKMNKLWLASIPLFGVIIVLYKFIVMLWLGKANIIRIDYYYTLIFGLYYFLFIKFSINTNFINGMEKLKMNSLILTIISIIKIAILLFLSKTSINWITIMFISFILLIPYIIIIDLDIRKTIRCKTINESF